MTYDNPVWIKPVITYGKPMITYDKTYDNPVWIFVSKMLKFSDVIIIFLI